MTWPVNSNSSKNINNKKSKSAKTDYSTHFNTIKFNCSELFSTSIKHIKN